VFNFNNPLYFYEDYVNENSFVIKNEPYLEYGYINKEKHLIESWCDSIGIEKVINVPELFFLENEIDAANIYLERITKNKKKLVLLQWVGGKTPKDKNPESFKGAKVTMYRRSLEQKTAQEIVNKLVDTGDYIIGDVGHPNFPELKNTTRVNFPIRSVLALHKIVDGFIGIDSFLQHAAASKSLNNPGIVCWGGTSPKCLGYDKHINLIKKVCSTPFCHRPNSYLFDKQAHGAMWDCIYGDKCMKSFTADKIVDAYLELNRKKEGKQC